MKLRRTKGGIKELLKEASRRDFIKSASGLLFVPVFDILVPDAEASYYYAAPAAGGGGAGFTFVKANHSTSDATSATSTVQLTTVTAGNLIIVGQKSEGVGEGATTGVSDGTSAFSVRTQYEHTNGDVRWQFAYLLSSVASGTVTYTWTRANAIAGFYWTFAMEFSYTGTPAYDTENGGSGTSTAVSSGNMTTTAANALVCGGYSHFNAVTPSSFLVNGAAADGVRPTSPGASNSAMWYKILTATMTNGTASCTLSSSSEWACGGIAIKAT